MAFCNRTLAIRAALGAGFLLILLNLLNSKLDSTSTSTSYSHLGATHWPKRTSTRADPTGKDRANSNTSTHDIINHRKANNGASQLIGNFMRLIKNASTLPTKLVSNNGLLFRQADLLDENVSTVSHENENILNGASGAMIRGNESELEASDKQRNVILNPINNSIPLNNSISIPIKVNDTNHTTSKSSLDSSAEHKLAFDDESRANNNTMIIDSNTVESSPTLPAKENHDTNTPLEVIDRSEKTFDRNDAENTLPSLSDKFIINNCPPVPPNLDGPIEVDVTYEPLSVVEKRYGEKLQPGGQYAPRECIARNRVAIIVPYRDREQHLPIFLKNIHSLLMKQQLEYGIYIVEQTSGSSFNRAALMNIGFVEAMKQKNWECMVFHDIDLLPMDDRNLYTCPDQPRHMSVAVDTFSFKLPYSTIFGGVSAMTEKQFRMVNGFSNSFWGWGGEDDDMSNRLKHVGFHIARYPVNIARYTMLSHKKEKANPKRYEKLVNGAKRYDSDGLNSLHYQLVNLIRKPLYTWIHAEITPDGS